MKRMLAVVAATPQFADFALPELRALLAKAEVMYHLKPTIKEHQDFPYVQFLVDGLTSNPLKINDKKMSNIRNILSHAVLIKKLVLLLGSAPNYSELFRSWDLQPARLIVQDKSSTAKFQFSSHNAHLPKEQQISIINEVVEQTGFQGSIQLSNPKYEFSIIESHCHPQPGNTHLLRRVYFGLDLANNRQYGSKISMKYRLSERAYLGPTSTDSELAFLMCHQANIDSNSIVIDPFVGTGSLLVPCAHYGAMTFGSDIDMRVLQGTKVGRLCRKQYTLATDPHKPTILLNFQQYGLKAPDIVRMDCLKTRLRPSNLFDAIICDPPYGLRAMSRSAAKFNNQVSHDKWQNFRRLEKASRQQIFHGLFDFSSRYLRSGGRLVCLYPVFSSEKLGKEIDYNKLPRHQSLTLIETSVNPITMGNARVLLTFEKQ